MFTFLFNVSVSIFFQKSQMYGYVQFSKEKMAAQTFLKNCDLFHGPIFQTTVCRTISLVCGLSLAESIL